MFYELFQYKNVDCNYHKRVAFPIIFVVALTSVCENENLCS